MKARPQVQAHDAQEGQQGISQAGRRGAAKREGVKEPSVELGEAADEHANWVRDDDTAPGRDLIRPAYQVADCVAEPELSPGQQEGEKWRPTQVTGALRRSSHQAGMGRRSGVAGARRKARHSEDG